MPRRPAFVTQADIARVLRALKQEGVPIARVIVQAGRVVIETAGGSTSDRIVDEALDDEDQIAVL